jgi:hypothetical protein
MEPDPGCSRKKGARAGALRRLHGGAKAAQDHFSSV